MTKPDFIIIGAMKSATSTLHEQLALQDGIFMTTPKEPNYFSDDEQYARGEAWYEGLFANAEANDLCGESSTHYTKLPDYPLTIERMAKRLKKVKLIYVLRHPVDRLISHYIHQWSQNVIKCDINEAIDQYEELTAYSCYARQLQPYIEQFGRENILLLFNESIRKNQQKELEKAAEFIGYKEKVVWQEDLAAQNVSNERIRAFPGYSWIVESEIMTFLRRVLIPKWLRNKIKSEMTLKERPVIDPVHLAQNTTIFDQDLARLGHALNVELSCETYKTIVINQELSLQHDIEEK
ncbi:sulfotransferase [Methyloprofundus sedimenti]|uniref:Sulfotransferase n=1 Tax=Methyloprofundus sedimenti TaxID=1420851 RepID=A0A1V8M6B7_9GAMM|nr:sulfotransferase domain-containing protein [Methyloprofundus sedimenti]OQK17036.1 sulfotransferase [Methyloprofundus sedimenti]